MTGLTVDVVVPSFRRPDQLGACLTALAGQDRPAERVLVVVRRGDDASAAVVRCRSDVQGLELVEVEEVGVVAAMRAGVASSTGAIVAFTDDDAEPRPDWIERLVRAFDDPTVGAVGGRDEIPGTTALPADVVGMWTGPGRLVGNHHLGSGPARDVDVLKGVNAAFRAEVLALPAPGLLRGQGAEPHHEVLACAYVQECGRRVRYDPAIVVVHHPGPRFDADRRGRPAPSAVFDTSYNFTIAAARDRRTAMGHAVATILRGTTDHPGLLRAAVAVLRREWTVAARLPFAVAGTSAAAWRSALTSSRHRTISALALRSTAGDRRVRVTLVAHAIHDEGGMERACAELVRRTANAVDYTVVAVDLAPDLRPLVADWVRVRVPGRPASIRFPAFFVLAGLALRRTPGIVHTVGAIVPNRVAVASVHYCHAAAIPRTGLWGPSSASLLRRWNTGVVRSMALLAERWCYRPARARLLTAVSAGAAEEAAAAYPLMTVEIVPNGVDLERFTPAASTRQDMRRARGVDDGVLVLVFIGGDWERKGLPLLIEAIAVCAPFLPVELWVVGAGDRTRYAERAAQLGVAGQVWFAGQRPDPERYLQAADVFVLPSRYESYSLAAFEAAACGLPLVLTDVHGAGELVRDGGAGVLVRPDVEDIVAAVHSLAGDPARRCRLGATARERVATQTWDRSAARMVEHYEALAGSEFR